MIGSRFFSLKGVVPAAAPVEGSLPSRRSGNGRPCPIPSGWRGLRRPSASALRRSDSRHHHRPPDDSPRAPGNLAGRLGGKGQPGDAQPRRYWGLVERQGKRGDTRYTLSADGIRYVTHRDRAQLPTTQGIWSTALTTDKQGRRRHAGHRIETWARQTKHADGITWFFSKLEAETRADPDSELQWSVPTARSDRAYNWGDSAIAPDAVGHLLTGGLHVPFYFEHELRAPRHPRGVIARLRPYESYYWSPEHKDDQPPFPTTLFVVDNEEVEDTYVRTATQLSRMSLPILVSCIPVLSTARNIGKVMASTVGAGVPETAPVRADRLPVRLALPPDASESCRGDSDDTSLPPLYAVWAVQNGTSWPAGEVLRGRKPPYLPLFQLRTRG